MSCSTEKRRKEKKTLSNRLSLSLPHFFSSRSPLYAFFLSSSSSDNDRTNATSLRHGCKTSLCVNIIARRQCFIVENLATVLNARLRRSHYHRCRRRPRHFSLSPLLLTVLTINPREREEKKNAFLSLPTAQLPSFYTARLDSPSFLPHVSMCHRRAVTSTYAASISHQNGSI